MIAFVPLLLATLSRALGAGSEGLGKDLARDALRIPFLLLPFLALGAGAAPGLIELVYGPSFRRSALLLAVLLGGTAASLTVSIASTVLVAIGRPRMPLWLSLPLVPLALGGFVGLVPRAGALGASVAYSGVMTLGALASLGAVYALWRLAPPVATLVRSAVLTGAAYGPAAALPVQGAGLLAALVALAGVVMILFAVTGEVSERDLATVQTLRRGTASGAEH